MQADSLFRLLKSRQLVLHRRNRLETRFITEQQLKELAEPLKKKSGYGEYLWIAKA
jgi:hypothetical protein